MRNKEKLSSDFNCSNEMYSSSNATLIEENTELDLYPDLLLDSSDGNLTIVINHDYYSSNSAHGRALLKSFLEVLRDEYNKISRVFIIDSGVLLLSPDNLLFDCFSELCDLDFSIIVCQESIKNYNVSISDFKSVKAASMHEIALELLSSNYLFELG